MKKTSLVLVLIVAIIASAFAVAPAGAGVCDGSGSIAGSKTIAVSGVAGETFYLEIREIQGDSYLYSIWIYQEANGVEGLQRGGASNIVPDDADPCNDGAPEGPDQVIF